MSFLHRPRAATCKRAGGAREITACCLCITIALVAAIQSSAAFGQLLQRPPQVYRLSGNVPGTRHIEPNGWIVFPSPVAPADTTTLAAFSFDDGEDPDLMGWTTVDASEQLAEYFHVASGSGELTGGTFGTLVPVSGNKSMWCGIAPGTANPECGYRTLPGYGHGWLQYFESPSLSGLTPPLSIDYEIQWDTEPGYDCVRLQALVGGQWADVGSVNGGLGVYDSYGFQVESIGLDPATERVRFVFESDDLWSDEDGMWPTDGAVLLDNITISDNGGTWSSEDFEDESDFATGTDTGWESKVPAPFGQFGSLYPGVTIPQEYYWTINESPLWAWFDDPLGKVPFGPDASGLYVHNVIESPAIAVPGAGGQYLLSFRTYRDVPLTNNLFYYAAVSSVVGGCRRSEWTSLPLQYGEEKSWVNVEFDISACVEPGTDSLVISIGVVDMAKAFGAGLDHTRAPYVDDVVLRRVDTGGPGISVQVADLFQDTFAEDGTTTGTARADAASDIADTASPVVQAGDSICIAATNVGTDPNTGAGPAAYCYVAVWPQGQSSKTGAKIQAPEKRPAFGDRYPLIDAQVIAGVTWNRFRMDYSFVYDDITAPNQYCFDLDDGVFEPGDTICYFFAAADGSGNTTYWSRRRFGLTVGQGPGFVTTDITEAAASPCEFQVLPGGGWAAGGDILYVDDADGAPVQPYFDDAFHQLGILGQVDRFDVLDPSVLGVSNSLASRVTSVATQLIGCYQKIIWSTGDLPSVLLGDGSGFDKSDDYTALYTFLDNHPNNPGLYLTGNHLHREWSSSSAPGAASLKSYFDFTLISGNHIAAGEGVSPTLVLSGSCFANPSPDTLVAYGGNLIVSQFDVLSPGGGAVSEAAFPGGSGSAILSQATANSASSTARVIGSGFSFHQIRDDAPRPVVDRVEHMRDILQWLGNSVAQPTGTDATPPPVTALRDAYPNPFNPSTTIRYEIQSAGHVTLKIYNAAGQLVKTLVNAVQSPRSEGFKVVWNGVSDAGEPVASGVYFVRFRAGGFVATRKVVLLK